MFKKILKIFLISIGSIIVLCGAVVGVLAVAGVFNEEVVALKGLEFEHSVYYIDNQISTVVTPIPGDSTVTTYTLSTSDQQVLTVPSEIKAGIPFAITPTQTNGVNNGGAAVITVSHGLYITYATVYVDIPVQSITLSATQQLQNNTLIVGNKANVAINYNSAKSEKPYGEYFDYSAINKSKTYAEFNSQTQEFEVNTFSIVQGENIASIDKETGEITALQEGEFTVQAKIFKSFKAKEEYEAHKLAGDFKQESWDEGEAGLVDGKTEAEYLAERVITNTKTFYVRNVELESITVNQPQNSSYIQDIYLYESFNFTYEDLGLTLTPEKASGLTAEEMRYRFKDVVATPVKNVQGSFEDISDIVTVTDLLDKNNQRIGWTVKPLKYIASDVNKTSLKFDITNSISSKEEVVSTQLRFNIAKNDIATGNTSFVLKSGNSNSQYNKNLNFFVYQNKEDGAENIVKDGFNLKQNTNIIYTDASKPLYMTVKYFIKDYNPQDYENRVINCVEETGEILDGIIDIVKAGTVEVVAKAIKIDEKGDIVYLTEGDLNSYEVIAYANTTSGSGTYTPLTINVEEKLTNIKMLINDENVITLKYIEQEKEYDALREVQTIKLELTSIDSQSTEEENQKVAYQSQLLAEMWNQNKLEIIAKNIDKLPNATITPQLTQEDGKTVLYASLFIPKANFVPEAGQTTQLLIKNVTFIMQLTEEAKEEYGEQAKNFINGELKFDVQTARPTKVELRTNTAAVESKEHEGKQAYRVKYLAHQEGSGWVVDGNSQLEIYANFNPIETAESTISISSNNDRLLKINTDSASKIQDKYATDEYRQTNSDKPEEQWTYVYKNILNLVTPDASDYENAEDIDGYRYLGEVTLTFTSTDNTFCTDPYSPIKGVFAEIILQLVVYLG